MGVSSSERSERIPNSVLRTERDKAMSKTIKELSDIQASALQEMGNIGAGHAAIALSQLIEKKIMMAVTRVKLLGLEEFIDLVGKDALVAGIHLRVLVEIQAGIILVFLKDGALATEKEITKYLRDRLAAHKIHKQVEFRTSLPKNRTGKILKMVLADEKTNKK